MQHTKKILQKLLSATLLLSMLGFLGLGLEGNGLSKCRAEIKPAKNTTVILISPILEESNEDVNDLHFGHSDFVFFNSYIYLPQIQSSVSRYKYEKCDANSQRELYKTLRTFRI